MFRVEPNPRKKKPKIVAVIDTNGCTGCEVCIDFCPVDCIDILPGPQHRTLNRICIVNEDVCIGCSLCAKYCPWETIPMVKYEPRLEDQETFKQDLAAMLGTGDSSSDSEKDEAAPEPAVAVAD